jgi:pantoate--beta-alanine ligase
MAADEAGMMIDRDSTAPEIARATTISALRQTVRAWRAQGETVALVPTMGALHAGHLSLVEEARRRCDRVVVSIFVNPAQFGAGEDLAAYPRDKAADLAQLKALGVDLAYLPDTSEMYRPGASTKVRVGGLGDGLCADFRPVHFTGVATVVAKLLLQCLPEIAIFGEKDYQQLLVIRRLAIDLDIPVEIVGAATLREADGLAMSSRNVYLSADARAVAGRLNRVMAETRGFLIGGTPVADALSRGRDELEAAGFEAIDYYELRDGETLAPLATLEKPARLLAAVHVGGCRLIDNIAVGAV